MIFLAYIHASSIIEENILVKAVQFKYALIIRDFSTNRKNKQLQQFIQICIFIQISTPPTFLMKNNPDSTPDIILCTNNIKNHISTTAIPDLTSDHLAIELIIDLSTPLNSIPDSIIKNNYRCDMKEFNNELIRHVHKKNPIAAISITEFTISIR